MLDNVGGELLVSDQSRGAELARRADRSGAARPRRTGRRSSPERPEPIESASTAGGKLFATYMKDVTSRAYVHNLDGTLENEIELPGPGQRPAASAAT